jgi:hypothetical protein
MQVMANGRVRRSPVERRELISRWKQSGLTPAQFCRREQIRLSSFLRWRKRERTGGAAGDFVAVTPAPRARCSWALEISLPNGCHLRFEG